MVAKKYRRNGNRGTTLPVRDRAGDRHYLPRLIDPWRLVRVLPSLMDPPVIRRDYKAIEP